MLVSRFTTKTAALCGSASIQRAPMGGVNTKLDEEALNRAFACARPPASPPVGLTHRWAAGIKRRGVEVGRLPG